MSIADPENQPESDRPSTAEIASDLVKRVRGTPRLDAEFTAAKVRFIGPSTVLPSSFQVTAAADALVAVFCSAVAGLEARVGATPEGNSRPADEPADVVVHSIASAAAFSSERHLRINRPADLWDELSGHYATADGFIQFHTNFEHHRSALLAATGCDKDASRAEVERVVGEADRFELEQRVIDAGGIAAALRTPREWDEHPHAKHVAGVEPLSVSPVAGGGTDGGDGRRRFTPGTVPGRPLAGLRVLDMTRVIAGPVCTRALAAYGADVLRIGADGLPVVGSILADTTLGKRFAHCDITIPAGRSAVLALAAEADVVVTGFRPGALANHGLDRAAFYDANPGLVLAELSAFGETGPWGGRPGFDSITQTATGVVATETAAFGSDWPRPLPCQLLDHGTGFLLAIGVVSAIANRLDGMGAQSVTASLLTTRNWLWGLGAADPNAGRVPDRGQLDAFIERRESPFGTMSHARPPGRITGVPARWTIGPSVPGADQPVWLAA